MQHSFGQPYGSPTYRHSTTLATHQHPLPINRSASCREVPPLSKRMWHERQPRTVLPAFSHVLAPTGPQAFVVTESVPCHIPSLTAVLRFLLSFFIAHCRSTVLDAFPLCSKSKHHPVCEQLCNTHCYITSNATCELCAARGFVCVQDLVLERGQ